MKDLREIKRKLEELREYTRDKYKAEIIGVFGSYACGEQREGSDVDILVKFHENATLFEFVGLSIFLEEELGISVDIVPYDAVREEIRDKVLKEAVYL